MFVMSRPRVDELDILNNINFNQAAEEVLLFGRELMKRNRHTYGTSFFLFFFFSFLCVSSFDLHPDPCAIWESVDEKMRALRCHVQSPSKCS